jgi:hypothetical protein
MKSPTRSKNVKELFTQVAAHASSVADVFRAAFGGMHLGACTIDLTRPPESTSGGKRALQHIRLNHPNGTALVFGHVDVATQKAGLRSYPWLLQAYGRRFGSPLDFDQATYLSFTKQAKDLLFTLSIDLEPITDQAPSDLDDELAPPRRVSTLAVAGAFLTLCVFATLAALVYVVLLRR